MMTRSAWFSFAMQKGTPGIRPILNKLSRFNLVVPLFAAGKIFFPAELRETPIMAEAISELSLATQSGIKGKDDFLDTISMLPELNAWLPTESAGIAEERDVVFGDDSRDTSSFIDSYIV